MPGSLDTATLSRLRFKQLALVASLIETGNLHTSSRQLNLSQPGATKLLKGVEDTLGVILFERLATGMVPTAFGTAVARHARQIIADTVRLKAQVDAMRRGEIGTVRLGAIMEAVPGVVASVLSSLAQSRSGPVVNLTVSTSDHLIAALNERTLDLALGRPVEHLDMSGIVFEPLCQEQLAIVAAPGHRLAAAEHLTLPDLQDFDWILQPRPSPMRTSIELAFARVGLSPPHHRLESASMLTTTIMVNRTDMLAVLPRSVAGYYIENGMIREIPVHLDGLMGQYGLLLPVRDEQDPGIDAMVQLIRTLSRG